MLTDDDLYASLNDVTTNLNRLLVDVRHNPKRYVSFSAIDMGKKIIVSDDNSGVSQIVYQVVLKESKEPLDFYKQIRDGKYKVFEDYRNSRYFYSIGQVRTFDEAQSILNEVKNTFDKAKIVALRDGMLISVKKAKKLAKK